MATQFARRVLRVAVAQICQNIGWHSVQSSPLDLLVDILQRYTMELSKTAHKYCNQYGRTEPNLDDLGLAFKELGIIIQEMEEYVNNVEPVAFAHKVSTFPVPNKAILLDAKPGALELAQRPEWIPEYLPAIHPELDDEEAMAVSPSSTPDAGTKRSMFDGMSLGIGAESPPLGSPHHSSKRPLEGYVENSVAKKPRLNIEEEGRPMREVTCVFMTSSGLITPSCEGRLPDPSRPSAVESPEHVPESVTDVIDRIGSAYPKKVIKTKDIRTIKKEKEKNRRMKELNQRKDKRIKLKPSKKEKENKGSVLLKAEKTVTSIMSIPIRKSLSCNSQKTKKSLKTGKNQDGKPLKVKNNKMKLKEGKDEKKNKNCAKPIKTKNKLKGSVGNKLVPIIKSPKSPKTPKSPSRAKSPIVARTPKGNKSPALSSFKSPINIVKEEPNVPIPLIPIKTEPEEKFTPNFGDDESREESPEPRLVIDDSAEAQARQEKECRMAVLDECIDAVIQRAMVESEKSAEENNRAMDQTIDEVVRNSTVKKIEPRDIYDFTDSSNSSPPLSPKNPDIGSPLMRSKKEIAKTPESSCCVITNNETPKKGKTKEKAKRKVLAKSKSPVLSSPKTTRDTPQTPTPSPTDKKVFTPNTPEKKELGDLGDDASNVPLNATKSITLPPCPLPPPPPLSHFPTSPFISSSPHTANAFFTNPFTSISGQFPSRPAFPTPPLFVPHRSDISTSFFPTSPSPQPLNLAMSGPNVPAKNSQEKKVTQAAKSSRQPDDNNEELNPAKKIKLEETPEKKEKKEVKKDKKEKTDKKEKSKKKGKEKEKMKEKEKAKPKEKVEKAKAEKKNKAKIEKDKKKMKEKEEKPKDDSSIPKITLKLGGNPTCTGTPKFVIKSTPKTGGSSHSSPPSSPEVELPVAIAAAGPPAPAPPPPPPEPSVQTPPEPIPSILLPPEPSPSCSSPVPSLPSNTMNKAHQRTGTKGKSSSTASNKKSSTSPPAVRTVITETLGTFVDESGNKIWICPACKQPDDGSPMIGCDECDDWYHWVCVGIVVPPKEEESWFCTRCIAKRQGANPKRKKKKHKKEK